jgi:hypothetical protein
MPSRSIVKHLLASCALAFLASCTTVAAGNGAQEPAVNDGQQYAMHVGETVSLPDRSTLRYVRLVNDSRCAPDVQCVWAGDAEVAFEWLPHAGVAQSFGLHTGVEPRQHPIGTRNVTLVSLARGAAPEATVRVEAAGTH